MAASADPAAAAANGVDAADAEGWALLEGLRRRLDDLSTQTRKTGAQVTQLADSIAAMVEAQRNRSRWLNINSFVAYVMFTMLCGGAFFFLYQSRTRELVAARDRAAADRDSAVERANAAAAALAARAAAEEKTTRVAQPDAAYWDPVVKAANASYQAGRYKEVVVALDHALSQNTAPTAEVHYLMGLAALKSAQIDAAVRHLRAATSSEAAQDDARFHLAAALERAGQSASARMEYDRFVAEHPESPSAAVAQRRSAALARGHAAPRRSPATEPSPVPATPAGEPAATPE